MFVWIEVMQMWYVIKCVQIGRSSSTAMQYWMRVFALGCCDDSRKMHQRQWHGEFYCFIFTLYVSLCCLHHQTRHTFKMQDRGFVLFPYVPGEQMKKYVHQFSGTCLWFSREASMHNAWNWTGIFAYIHIPWVSLRKGKRMWNVNAFCVQH